MHTQKVLKILNDLVSKDALGASVAGELAKNFMATGDIETVVSTIYAYANFEQISEIDQAVEKLSKL